MDNIFEIRDVKKSFPGIMALKGVSFDIQRNTVHCIVGENGAGKSTLIKILAGVQKSSSGEILLNGKHYAPGSTRAAMQNGVSVLFQELNTIEQLTVEENMTLGLEKSKFGIIQKSNDSEKFAEILAELDPSISMKTKMGTLSVGKKQIIQIAKAIATKAEVLIMDEPTAALSEDETKRLFAVVSGLHAHGLTIIYISHKLEEIFAIGDNVTVLLDGQVVKTAPLKELSHDELIRLMLGKVVSEKYVPSRVEDTCALHVESIRTSLLKDVSFDVRKGEIFGFYGLIGAGKTEIARAISGIDPYAGKISYFGREMKFSAPSDAFRNGVCIVPEERRTQGIIAGLPIRENITLTNPGKISRAGIRSRLKEISIADGFAKELGIACRNIEQAVGFLSGGNQQKVVIAKCLNSNAAIMLLDEPTRGVDVGAKEEIHSVIRTLANGGKTVVVFSSELPEIMNLCDRIAVLYEGRLVEIFENGSSIDAQRVMHVALGG